MNFFLIYYNKYMYLVKYYLLILIWFKNWKDKMEKEQETLTLSEDPKLSIKSIHEKMAYLDREVSVKI